ncbi:MAG: hypothetical protein J0I19_01175 [Alphaproteobacteria bacterium]|nr:hypothetical protein [Alphaproteobacteria bacterium]
MRSLGETEPGGRVRDLCDINWSALHAVWSFVSIIGDKLNGNFPAALFGAMGGSASAYWLGVRNDRRNRLREEIAATNNAIGLITNIMNIMLSLKGQHVKPITDRYEQSFAEFFAIAIAPNPPPPPRVFELQANFQIIAMPETMIGDVQRVIIEKVTRSTFAQMLVGSLQRSLAALARTLDLRTQIIMNMRQVPQPAQILYYFGLRDGTGNQDDTFPDTLTAMKAHVDEGIYYSELLIEILGKHGKALRKVYGRRAPIIVKTDNSDPRFAQLWPDRSQFKDFEEQFRAPEKPGRWPTERAWISRNLARMFSTGIR